MTRCVLFGHEFSPALSYRIPALYVLSGGAQFAFCEAREGTGDDWDPARLTMRRRLPGGDWEAPVELCRNEHGPAHNPAPFETGGRLHLIYGLDYARVFHIHSAAGVAFSQPEEITYAFESFRAKGVDWHCIAVGPGGVCQMESGRIVAPVWLGGLVDPRVHNPATTATIYSDDDGNTWRAGEVIDFFDYGPSEAQIAPVPGGAIISLRNADHRRRRAFAFSPDGVHWGKPRFARDVVEINCQGSLIRVGDELLIAGPEPIMSAPEAHPPRRERLKLRRSRDFGAAWSEGLLLEPGVAGYSALQVAQDGTLLCLYETWEDPRRMRQVLVTLSLNDIP